MRRIVMMKQNNLTDKAGPRSFAHHDNCRASFHF